MIGRFTSWILRSAASRLGTVGKRRLAVLCLHLLYVGLPFKALSIAAEEFRDATVGLHVDLQRHIKAVRTWSPAPETAGSTASTADVDE
ncbi:hypothetical protein [Parvibaculum sp.]|uniref:hypothetical protein n=1 Tax=Parvibaculum sp. TaxID=2024848 RepID=UPI0027365752|nr:hypothetical protein [Parvibaculum sp.]MDP3328733.1 hypothetical protein [Parvibaculum sp.]